MRPTLRGPCSACAARRLYFLGTRSCFAISYHFAYAYSMIAGNGVLVHGLGGTYPDQLDAAGPEDLLVCVTQNPYGRQTLEAARDCRQAGVPVLALTDSPLAPIQAHATQALLFDAGTPSYFHSMVGSLALVERLLAAGRRRRRGRATAHRRLRAAAGRVQRLFRRPVAGPAPGRQENMTGFRVAGRA